MCLRALFFTCLFCTLFSPFRLWAQPQGNLKFTSLTTQDGLSSNIVNTILKDHTGMLWIGTQEGLDKFNGREFKVYRFDSPREGPYYSQDVKALYEDSNGNLWIGLMGGGLFRYDRTLDIFVRYPTADWTHRLSSNYISSICCDHTDKLWLATLVGVNVMDFKTKKITVFQPDNRPGSIGSSNIIDVFEDSNKRIWVGTDKGLYLYDPVLSQFRAYKNSAKDERSLAGDLVTNIAEDHFGRLWVGTDNGLSLLDSTGNYFRNFRYDYRNKESISGNMIYKVAADNNNYLWIGTEGGLDKMDVQTGKVTRYEHDERDSYSLNSKSIRNIYIDLQGIYWLSTYENGIEKYDQNLTLFDLKQTNEFDKHGLSGSLVNAFAENYNGDIFIGTDGAGLDLFHPKIGLFDHIPISSKVKVNTVGMPILSMKLDHNDNLWIGTYQNGLFSFNVKTHQYNQFIKGTGKENLNSNDIFCVNEDHQGNIWIGTNGNGINVYNPKDKSFKKFTPTPSSPSYKFLPVNGYIRALEFDHNGNTWIGTFGGGVAIYNPQTEKFKVFDPMNTKLPIDKIISMLEDRDGNMWLGTNGNGLFVFNTHTQTIAPIYGQYDMSNAVIHKILQDERGVIWFSTNNSITSYNPATKKYTSYSESNGLQNNSFLDRSGLRAKNGTLYFGGNQGFNYFSPPDIMVNRNIPPVVLTSLRIDNKLIAPGKNSPIHEDISVTKTISLDYKQNFAISFAALNYTLPGKNTYAYILKGFDKTWNIVGQLNTAYYTNLDPGEYVFTVKAANNNNVWNNQGASIKIVIRPPFWMTYYAYFLYVAAVLTILWFIRRQGIRKLKMQQREKEAETLHELDLMKIKFLTNLSHEFRTPISLILAPADRLLAQYKDHQLSEQLFVIKRNARRLLNLVNQLLDFRKLEEQELKLNSVEGEVIAFINDLTESFRDLSSAKKISLTFNKPSFKLFTKFDHDKIERIVFNLLSNAFKFTQQQGKVEVAVSYQKANGPDGVNSCIITVSDTGIGIAKDKLDLIFERFYQDDALTSAVNQGSGIGLSITRELVQMQGGTISVTSLPDNGSVFTVSLPLEDAQYLEEANPAVETDDLTKIATLKPVNINNTDQSGELPHVLIIEDNEELRFYLVDSLRLFYKVTEAEDGKDGWQKALSVHPDIIVSDVSMPYMDGIALSRKLKADKRTGHIPIILLTALTRQEEELAGLETGASDYLTKPFNFEVLNLKIRNLLRLNKSLKDTYSKQIKVTQDDIAISSSSEKFLKSVVQYIEDNFNNPKFSVENLSQHFSMSRGALYSKLLELTGLPPVEFIRTIKLDRAAVLLEKSDLSVGQIAYAAGFATPHYFTKSFKAKFHLLPTEYRNKRKTDKNVLS